MRGSRLLAMVSFWVERFDPFDIDPMTGLALFVCVHASVDSQGRWNDTRSVETT